MAIETTDLKTTIKKAAFEIGFDAIGFTQSSLPQSMRDRLMQFLTLGRHGEMNWLENRTEKRAHPNALWPEARSIIMLGMNYGPERDPLAALKEKSCAAISVYAQNRDYHDIIKKRLKRLARRIVDDCHAEVKVFVDTAPVMEKPLAERAGLGWQGKHTNLVSREFGSWLFLGAIYTTAELEPDDATTDHCGSCRNCLDVCPTDAFPAPYQLDARRCISYLTIEHPGPIPREFRNAVGNRIYGCDDCLAVCPWNKFASEASQSAFHAREELKSPALSTLARLDDAAFRQLFSGSPVKRTGRNRFVRNVLIAIGNSGDSELVPIAETLLDDESPIVRGAAIWALSKLSATRCKANRRAREQAEADESVLEEWRATV